MWSLPTRLTSLLPPRPPPRKAPKVGMGFMGALVDQREHRLAHRLSTPNSRVGCHPPYRPRYQLDGRVRGDRPVRNEERAGTSIEERTRQTRECLGFLCTPCHHVARRQDHPIGIELEGGNLGCGQVPVIALGRGCRRGQDQSKFRAFAQLTRERSVGQRTVSSKSAPPDLFIGVVPTTNSSPTRHC
jgi:hypothetical protein